MNFALTMGGWIAMGERKAVVIVASQKTLPIAVAVLSFIPETTSGFNTGIASIACVLAHFVQILIDAFIATRLADVPNGLAVPTPQQQQQQQNQQQLMSPQSRGRDGAIDGGGGGGDAE